MATTDGDIREAGLPNIEGTFVLEDVGGDNPPPTGAFNRYIHAKASTLNPGAFDLYGTHVSFSAERSSDIYGKSVTVQPPAVTAVPCIKAFGSVVNDLGVPLSDILRPELTEERVVARYNGKNVYEKTMSFTTGSVGIDTPVADFSGLSIDELLYMNGLVLWLNGNYSTLDHFAGVHPSGESYYFKTWFERATGRVFVQITDPSAVNSPGTVTIRYTKTTD